MQDLLTAGALLHDIGKLEELDYDRSTSYSREGNLVGHVTLGVIMVRTAMTRDSGLSRRLTRADRAPDRLAPRPQGVRRAGGADDDRSDDSFGCRRPRREINQVRLALAEEGEGEFTATIAARTGAVEGIAPSPLEGSGSKLRAQGRAGLRSRHCCSSAHGRRPQESPSAAG